MISLTLYSSLRHNQRQLTQYQVGQRETLLHEQVHLWQQNFGEYPVKSGRVSDNKEFTEKCESLKLHPMPNVGCHIAVADGVFAQFMNELGILRPDDVPRIDGAKADGKPLRRDWFRPEKEKGRSTLHKWTCPDCGLAVRIGIGSDPRLVHDSCNEFRGEKVFLVLHDGLPHTIYDGDEIEDRPPIISQINELTKDNPEVEDEVSTLEGIAETLGIGTKTLYQWAKNDTEFSAALERPKEVQENDPFKTGTSEDKSVAAMTLTLLLIETWDRHYKPNNL